MNSTLQRHACTIRPVVRTYDGNHLRAEIALEPGVPNQGWIGDVVVVAIPGRKGEFDLDITFRFDGGAAESSGVGVAVEFEDWSPENYVLLPSAVYDGNNFDVWDTKYPPLWRDPEQFRPDMPTTTTPMPRLGAGSARIEQTTGDTAAPVMGFYSAARGQGFLLLTTQQTRLGNSGLTVESTGTGKCVRFLVTAPSVREFRQDHCKAVASVDHGADWTAGDQLTLRLRASFFSASELQCLFDRFCDLRKVSLDPSRQREADCQSASQLPFSAAWRILEEKYHRDNWDEKHGYFRVAPNAETTFEVCENPLCFLWQLGWVGGGIATLLLMFQGTDRSQQRAWRNLEMLFERTAAPSGFFYGIGDGEKFYSDGFDCPHPHHLHMVRKSGDALLFAIKHFDLFRKQGREIPGVWLENTRKLADAFVRLWQNSGQFGQFVDIETGALLVGGSAGGAIVPAALARAAWFFQEPGYLRVAEAACRKYGEDFVRKGITNGGPGEILSAPDSESAFALLESLVTVLEVSGDASWQKPARDMVRQCATWVVAYDYAFPPESPLSKAGVHSMGAVWANVQNKHAAPAICTLSGDALLRLWRASGDPLALDLIRDIAHGIPQYLSREDRPLGGPMQPGWMCERVNLSDWEGAKGVGANLFGSCWAEVSLMLTIMEIPGLYVQPDTGFFCVFDHIQSELLERDAHGVRLKLTNPTQFDAEVKVLCEPSTACARPLGLNTLFGARIVCVPAGKSVVETFS
ncbi:MAG: hypothetical protein WCJ35_19760 [Planctomycetota bacterium]